MSSIISRFDERYERGCISKSISLILSLKGGNVRKQIQSNDCTDVH